MSGPPTEEKPVGTERQPKANPTLADDTDPDREEQGRIGYGKLGRWSPVGLAVLILIALGATYVVEQFNDRGDNQSDGSTTTGELLEPRPAPDFELELMGSDETLTLEELRGKIVVLNFWASWCGPCREEMPALQQSSESSGDDVVFVGVGAKNDKDADAEAFAEEFGITYPIGRDTKGGDSLAGQIEKDYGVVGYPATFFISPDGNINQIVFGALEIEDLEEYIANASD